MEIGAIGSQNYNYAEIPKKIEKNSGPVEEKSETKTTLSTDEVDAEIEELKKRRLELKKICRLRAMKICRKNWQKLKMNCA